jgi:hypothetical protein
LSPFELVPFWLGEKPSQSYASDYLAGAAGAAGAAAGAAAAGAAAAGASAGAGEGAGACTASAPCFSPLMSKLSPPLEITNKAKPANTAKPTAIFHITFLQKNIVYQCEQKFLIGRSF